MMPDGMPKGSATKSEKIASNSSEFRITSWKREPDAAD
jgi:hypothetical protein